MYYKANLEKVCLIPRNVNFTLLDNCLSDSKREFFNFKKVKFEGRDNYKLKILPL